MDTAARFTQVLSTAGITVNGPEPWDPQVHDVSLYARILSRGMIAVGEGYMDGAWDVPDLAAFCARCLTADFLKDIWRIGIIGHVLRARLTNLQNTRRAFQVGERHYDIGNDLYERMLDSRMTYSCGYWSPSNPSGQAARDLDEAQERKLDLVCRKIGLKAGDRVLDIGSGWGSFAIFAARAYGARVVGVTVSKEQAALATERGKGLPVEFRIQDYRSIDDGPYDHVVSIGMFEHVGHKNYRTYFETARRLLKPDGLFLLHTIGDNRTPKAPDPWFHTYIFPNGILPSPKLISAAIEGLFVMEDWHNFGADYEKTLVAWWENFDRAWGELKHTYDERFYRMWKFYLLSMAGSFRVRHTNLWQIVLSPHGVPGGYRSVR